MKNYVGMSGDVRSSVQRRSYVGIAGQQGLRQSTAIRASSPNRSLCKKTNEAELAPVPKQTTKCRMDGQTSMLECLSP